MAGSRSPGDALAAVLRDPAELNRLLIEESSDVLAVHEPDGRLRWTSPTIERLLGWTAEERMTATDSLIHPDDRTAIAAVQSHLREGHEAGSTRVRLLHKDGHYVWAVSSARAWRDDDGAIIGLVIVTHGIDDVVRAEEERRDVVRLYRLIAENANDIVLDTLDGVIRWVSPSVTELLGWKPEQLAGRQAWDFLHPDDLRSVQQDAEQVDAGASRTGRARARCADGTYRWMARTQRPLLDADGTVMAHVTGLRDVHEQVLAEVALRESEEHYRLLAESAADFTVQMDGARTIMWVSPSVERVLGWRPEQIVGTDGATLLHPDHLPWALQSRAELLAGRIVSGRARVRRCDGTYVWLAQTATPVMDANGEYAGHVSGYHDVDAQVRAELALAASEERFRTALAAAPTGMAVVGLDRRHLLVNQALCRMLERDEEWLLAHTTLDVVHPDDSLRLLALRDDLLTGAPLGPIELRVVTGSGRVAWVQLGAALLHGDDGNPTGLVAQLIDITETRAAREQLRELATHDQLTGALLRDPLDARLDALLSRRGRGDLRTAVLYVDVDGLRDVNNTLGHGAGDALLRSIVDRMRLELRAEDLLARPGGDEFVIVLPGVAGVTGALVVAEKLHAAVRGAVDLRSSTIRPTISIGLALSGHGRSASDLVEAADQAVLVAKQRGKDQTAVDRLDAEDAAADDAASCADGVPDAG